MWKVSGSIFENLKKKQKKQKWQKMRNKNWVNLLKKIEPKNKKSAGKKSENAQKCGEKMRNASPPPCKRLLRKFWNGPKTQKNDARNFVEPHFLTTIIKTK